MENSLQERASEWAKWKMSATPYPENGSKSKKEMWQMTYDSHIQDYIDIAKEQQEQDIDTFYDFMYDNCGVGTMEWFDGKGMDMLKQIMKDRENLPNNCLNKK